MLHVPKKITAEITSPYEILGLKDLPFPTDPVVNPYSYDSRRNGTILLLPRKSCKK